MKRERDGGRYSQRFSESGETERLGEGGKKGEEDGGGEAEEEGER